MGPLAIIMLAMLVYEVADAAVEAYTGENIMNNLMGTTSQTTQAKDAMETLNDTIEILIDRLEWVVTQVSDAIYDAAMAIMQYMDAWGTVIVVLFAVVIVILLAMFFNVAKLRRSR